MKKLYNTLTKIQKSKFKSIAGYDFDERESCKWHKTNIIVYKECGRYEVIGAFSTDRPYDKQWDLSPWWFTYILEPETGFLICELDHRMTNNRIYGWDRKGNELTSVIKEKYFKPHF